VIGDVSGKGMPAALFMAVCRTLVKATALSGLGPAACLQRVNTLLLADNPSDMFVTLFYAILDLRSGEGPTAMAGTTHRL
jgi:sigma-B regulation protein RsbU (phosphoserine phosphatase)